MAGTRNRARARKVPRGVQVVSTSRTINNRSGLPTTVRRTRKVRKRRK